MALPQALSYDVLPNSAMSRTYKSVISSRNNTTFNCNQRMEFSLPQSESSYIDLTNISLKFKLQATVNGGGGSSQGAHLDFSVLSAISRVVVSCGGQVLSDISGYNYLATALIQASSSPESLNSYGRAGLGCSGVQDLPLLGDQVTLAGKYYSIPMSLGIFSAKKMLPLDLSSPVVISIYLTSLEETVFCPTNNDDIPANLQFSECEIHAYVCQLNAEAQLFLDNSLGEMSYNWNITDVSNMSVAHGTGNTSTVLPFRYSSLKSVVQLIRNSTSIGNTGEFSVSGRSKNGLSEFYLDVGGDIVPSRRIRCANNDIGEVMTESMVALFGNTEISHQGSLNTTHINRIQNAAGDALDVYPAFKSTNNFGLDNSQLANPHTYSNGTHTPGTFLAAISLESYKPATDSESLMCGLNTIGSQISWNNKASGAGNTAATYEFYGFYDSVISLDPVTRILTANA